MGKKLLIGFLILLSLSILFISQLKTIPIQAEDTSTSTKYEEWLKEFWRYSLRVSSDDTVENGNPCLINVPANIALPIMLLDPFEVKKVKQTCTLPSDREILIPAFTGECDTGSELGKSATSEEILKCALAADVGFLDFELNLDGKKIVDIKGATVGDHINTSNFFEIQTSNLFEVDVPNNSQWINDYEEPGTYLAHAHGFFAKLDKLSPGKHTLKYTQIISGSRGLSTIAGLGGANEVLYDITVK